MNFGNWPRTATEENQQALRHPTLPSPHPTLPWQLQCHSPPQEAIQELFKALFSKNYHYLTHPRFCRGPYQQGRVCMWVHVFTPGCKVVSQKPFPRGMFVKNHYRQLFELWGNRWQQRKLKQRLGSKMSNRLSKARHTPEQLKGKHTRLNACSGNTKMTFDSSVYHPGL